MVKSHAFVLHDNHALTAMHTVMHKQLWPRHPLASSPAWRSPAIAHYAHHLVGHMLACFLLVSCSACTNAVEAGRSGASLQLKW